MLTVIGVLRKSGTYEGHQYDNFMMHCVNDSPSDAMIAGSACEIVKIKAQNLQGVFSGAVRSDSDWRDLIGSKVRVFYDRNGNPMEIQIEGGGEKK